ncbi:MAG: dihydrodipicolinate synthase family protein, partial [Halobacteriaceae archaeon]
GLTGRALSVETVVDLAAHGNVVGVKDSSGDLPRFGKLLERTPDGFAVLQGHTAAAVAALDLGADGVVAGEANVRPGALAAVYDAHERGDRDRAADLHRERVAPVTHAVTDGPVLPSLKFLAGRAHGVDVGPPLLPLPELDDDRRAELAGVLD